MPKPKRKPSRRSARRRPILILSDLHLTSGKDDERGVWSPTEDFFWDAELKEFLEYYGPGGGATLVVNGDFIDFLQILARPSDEERELYGIPAADVSTVYGLKTSEAAAAYQVDKVVDGHPEAFRAFADWLAGGNSLIFLKGNHDVQFFWEAPRDRLRQRILGLIPSGKRASSDRRLEILPWVYYLPGRLYVEHGNQYEPATSFQNFLYPILPFDSAGGGRHIELDLGGMIIRYFANRMEVRDLLSDNIRPLSAYLATFVRRHPFVALSMVGTIFSYLVNAFTKSGRPGGQKAEQERRRIEQTNTELIEEEAIRSAERREAIHEIQTKLRARDLRKAPPALAGGPIPLAWQMLQTPLRAVAALLPLTGLWAVGTIAALIARTADGLSPGLWKDLLEYALAVRGPQILLVVIIIWATIALGRRFLHENALAKDRRDIVLRLRREAEMIAREMDVRVVVFGHTHREDIVRLPGNRWYFNTGTWMSVRSEDENLYRMPHQCTYVEITGSSASLRYWDPASRSPAEAVVIDPDAAHSPPEETAQSLLRKALRMPKNRPGNQNTPARLREFFLSRLQIRSGRREGS